MGRVCALEGGLGAATALEEATLEGADEVIGVEA